MSSPKFITFSFSYFCYFAILGLAVPFLAVFLDGRGFDSLEIGELLAIFTATKIIGPTLWANAADKSGNLTKIIQLGSALALLSFSFLFWVESYWPIAFVLAIFSLFWTAIQPQLEVLTLASIRRSAHIYARIRLWGSIGFIVTVTVAGEAMVAYHSEAFVIIGWALLLALLISSLLLKQQKITHTKKAEEITSLKKRILTPSFILFFIAGLLLQLSFAPYYSFFALYLRDLQYPSMSIGLLISLGALAEIVIFVYAGKLYRLFGPKVLISFSILVTALRWYLTGHFANFMTVIFFAQLLHAASFGLYHTASIQYLQQHFDAKQQNRAQAIYIAGVYGVGGAIGAYLAGYFWQNGVGATLTFELAAYCALIAGILVLFMNNRRKDLTLVSNTKIQ